MVWQLNFILVCYLWHLGQQRFKSEHLGIRKCLNKWISLHQITMVCPQIWVQTVLGSSWLCIFVLRLLQIHERDRIIMFSQSSGSMPCRRMVFLSWHWWRGVLWVWPHLPRRMSYDYCLWFRLIYLSRIFLQPSLSALPRTFPQASHPRWVLGMLGILG